MRSLLRSTLWVASGWGAGWAITGCSNESETTTGKMNTGTMGGPMAKMDTGKMDKMDTGKMGGAMDKMK